MICNIGAVATKFDSHICDPSNVITDDFGKQYVELKGISGKLRTGGNVAFEYRSQNLTQTKGYKMMNETKTMLYAKVNRKIRLLNGIFYIFKKLMVFMYIKILYGKSFIHDS
jgi:hypothetical protein